MSEDIDAKIRELEEKVKQEVKSSFMIPLAVLIFGVFFIALGAIFWVEILMFVGMIMILCLIPCLCGSDSPINVSQKGEQYQIQLNKLKQQQQELRNTLAQREILSRKNEEYLEQIRQKELLRNYQRCPYCNAFNENAQNYCERCGKDLGIPTLKYCPICGYVLSDEGDCDRCGMMEINTTISKIDLSDESSRFCTNCGKNIPFESKFCPICAEKIPRIYLENVDEDFDNKTGINIKHEEKFCVCCGEKINNKLSVCKKCQNLYFKGLDAIYPTEFASSIKKVQPPIIHSMSHGGKYLFKIILVGNVNKTPILNRYTTGQFNSDTKMTIGVDFGVHYLELADHGAATLQIWDFGEEERFRTMLPSFCQCASGALLFFDLIRTHTFYELDEWVKLIRRNTHNIPIILLGENYHLIRSPSDLDIDPKQVMSFIQDNKINGYLSISSKTGYNVNKCFDKLTELMIITKPTK